MATAKAETDLAIAIRNYDLQELQQRILKANPSALELLRALHLSIRVECNEAIPYLLNAGAEVNGYIGEHTALHVAIEAGNKEALILLLVANAHHSALPFRLVRTIAI